MTPSDFRVNHRLRVRWAEVDIQKIVFNGHYLMYFDNAIADYWRALALPYELTMHQLGGDLFVKKAALEYHASAEMDDWLDVCMKCERMGNSSLTYTGAIFRGDELLVSCEMVYVYANPVLKKSQPIPTPLRDMILGFEAGQDMVQMRQGSWAELQTLAAPLRSQVFVQEQKVPQELEWDSEDATALHVVAVNRLGTALATGRLIQHAPGVSRLGRMAVMKVMRGSDLGKRVLQALIAAAKTRGDREIIIHAQCSAQTFYAKAGFVAEGDVFDEAGIAHVPMRLTMQ